MIARNGFWNSLLDDEGNADRLYNADDLTFFYDKFFHSGILEEQGNVENAFKVTLTAGSYSIQIENGDCVIDGRWYRGAGQEGVTLQMPTTHTLANGYARTDAVCIRKNEETRDFEFYIKEGEVTSQNVIKPPAIDKNEELCLAYYQILSTYSVQYETLVDTREDDDFCGYAKLKITPASSNPEFDDYIKRYYYFANGVDDNIQLSKMVQKYYLNETERNCKITVIGKVGIKGWAAGKGTADDPFCVFVLGKYNNTETGENTTSNTNNVKVEFLDRPTLTFSEDASGYSVQFFGGTANKIKNVVCFISSSANASTARMLKGGNVIEDSQISVTTGTGTAIAVEGTITARNCTISSTSTSSGNATATSGHVYLYDCTISATTSSGVAKAVEGYGIVEECSITAKTTSGEAYGVNLLDNSNLMRLLNNRIMATYSYSESSGIAYGVFIAANYTRSYLYMNGNIIDAGRSVLGTATTNTFKLNSGTYVVFANFSRKAGFVHDDTNVFNNIVAVPG